MVSRYYTCNETEYMHPLFSCILMFPNHGNCTLWYMCTMKHVAIPTYRVYRLDNIFTKAHDFGLPTECAIGAIAVVSHMLLVVRSSYKSGRFV